MEPTSFVILSEDGGVASGVASSKIVGKTSFSWLADEV